MDAMRAANGDRIFVLLGAPLEGGEQRVEIGEQDVGGTGELHGQRRVEHVRTCHALVDEARVRPNDFAQMRQEGDDVVLGGRLDLIDASDVEGRDAALVPDRLRRLFRHDAEIGEGEGGVRLDLEPDAELGLGRPDGHHVGAGIARDHVRPRWWTRQCGWRRCAARRCAGRYRRTRHCPPPAHWRRLARPWRRFRG